MRISLDRFNLDLDYCWVCENTFSDRGGKTDYIRHVHHIIPQAFGGKDGPTVCVCSGHHNLLHFVALKLIANKPFTSMVEGLAEDARMRLLYLASRVKLASNFAKGDPNKKVPVSLKFNGKVNQQLVDLVHFRGLSKEKVIVELIQSAHARYFPRKPSI